jgi:hypothetical protein
MESLPVKKSKSTPKLNRWIIETPRNRENLPSPIGFTNSRADVVTHSGKGQGPDQSLLDKRNWDIAFKNFKSIPMTLFMFYMVGDSINIMPILMIGGYLWSTIGQLMKVGSVLEQLKKNSPSQYPLQLLTWIFGQLLMLGCLMWKCNRMGLLPTHDSDWLAFRDPIKRLNFIKGGQVM